MRRIFGAARIVLTCLIAAIFLRCFVVQTARIVSGSMEDTVLAGDTILIDCSTFALPGPSWESRLRPLRPVGRGDLLLLVDPLEPERTLIKRAVGLPGETIEMRSGELLVDGVTLYEPYLNELYRSPDNYGPLTLADGRYFVLGDQRRSSRDSRDWGPVPRSMIRGRPFLVLVSSGSGASASGSFRGAVAELLTELRPERTFHPLH